ncbi:ABC transporter substrate-binding protein [Parasphingopyxis lamellibrachiae]|uniref:Peptide/nickel transport system substrate-binding protein n=1 Tax=Parasphingopyxis lamellibrachiae TaxID=680125 RepID=A0A3D9FBJ6_9SPHN|nr:ABC transporter substrate-binding protein [Parasphingopyxis lamellibrachiae]RED15093.1 peptide/nickel transport system substrate-binding protein [Parasphingopyxis lamellibrachiae]
MNRTTPLILAPILALFSASCADGEDLGPMRVDMIGEATAFTRPIAALPSPSDALLLEATAQGLVRLDGEGQIEPALAQRWIVLDEGQTYVFRLNEITWDDGTAVTARQIAQQLRNASRSGSRNRLARLLADIDAVQAVTPQIVEINLSRPRLDFLQLLAAPDLAIFVEGRGLGPYTLTGEPTDEDETVYLAPRREPPEEIDGDTAEAPPISPEETVQIRFGPAPAAVARFDAGHTDIVLGGNWTTIFYADAIDPNSSQLRIDPVDGLFGLAIVEQTEFLSEPQNREILSLALDRGQLAGYFGGNRAEARLEIVPPDVEGLNDPVGPPWASSTMDLRRAFARDAIAEWRTINGEIEPIRVALPEGAGSRVIFAVLRTNWAVVGIPAVQVAWDADADLRLVDRVAATESATWYLQQFRCSRGLPCSDAYTQKLSEIEEAPSARVRAIRIAEAATELQRITPFIPLLRPIRWSLVSQRIAHFSVNRFGRHPLDTLAPPS